MRTTIKILILLVTITFSLEMDAQSSRSRRRLNSDIYIGLNLSEFDIKQGNKYNEPKLGFRLGFLAQYKVFKDFQLQTGLIVTKKGLKQKQYTIEKDVATAAELITDRELRMTANYIQIPFNIGWEHYFNDNFALNINVGLFWAYGFRGKSTQEGSKYNSLGNIMIEDYNYTKLDTFHKNRLKDTDYGINGWIGMSYDIYMIQVGYDHGLANISNVNNPYEYHTRNFFIGAGFRF